MYRPRLTLWRHHARRGEHAVTAGPSSSLACSKLNPLLAARFFDFRFFTFRGLSCAGLIQTEQLFHGTVACTCRCTGTECQLVSAPRWDVSNFRAQTSKFRCFQDHYRAVAVRVQTSMAVSTYQSDCSEIVTTS